jgi:hypothetical protein
VGWPNERPSATEATLAKAGLLGASAPVWLAALSPGSANPIPRTSTNAIAVDSREIIRLIFVAPLAVLGIFSLLTLQETINRA